MSTYLVTGAAGFIGGAVARKLITNGHAVVTIDNLSTGYRDQVPDGVELIEGNCFDVTVLEQLGERALDAIIHIAGQSSGETSFDDPIYDLQTNAQSTLMLMKHALNVGCKKFIYASSMAVYGDKKQQPVGEDVIPITKSFYAVGKLASENYMRIYSELGLAATALRLFNVYGPGQNLKNLRQGLVSIFLAQAIDQKNIHVKGSADRYRDLVYIDDVVDAFLKAVEHSKPGYQVCNIGTGVKTTIADVLEAIRKRLPYDVLVKYEGNTPGDMHGIYANVREAERILEWSAQTGFDTGMDRMVRWALPSN